VVIPEKVTNHMNAQLIIEITKYELHQALKALPTGKAPGEDRLPAEFFTTMWETVGGDILETCLEALNSGKLHQNLNTGLLCLIPKRGTKTN